MVHEINVGDLNATWLREKELWAVGFSRRTARALIYSLNIQSLEVLGSMEWGSRKGRRGLCWELSMLPGIGPKGEAEVIAFREYGDARRLTKPGPVKVLVPLGADLADSLDAWIANQPKPVSRPEAIRAMVEAAMSLMVDSNG
jgi:hypothetical protein